VYSYTIRTTLYRVPNPGQGPPDNRTCEFVGGRHWFPHYFLHPDSRFSAFTNGFTKCKSCIIYEERRDLERLDVEYLINFRTPYNPALIIVDGAQESRKIPTVVQIFYYKYNMLRLSRI